MATLRFEPIATQVGKVASPARLFPVEVVERLRRGEHSQKPDPAWSAELGDFMLHYTSVVRAAHMLLGAPAFERLSLLHDELEREYAPGGPPMSPVYNSHLVQHLLGGVPQGLARETPYTVLARLSSGDAPRARLHELAESLASSHLDLYRVTRASAEALVADLVAIRSGEALTVHTTGPFLRDGDRFLGRVVAFGGRSFIADSPYLLDASEQDWLEYFERRAATHAAERQPTASGGKPPEASARSGPKLTSKQAARRRKEQQLKAARNTPPELVARHLRHGLSERYWLDYIVDGYAGSRRGIARLAGVPDRPETLPHAEGNARAGADASPAEMQPMERVRERLVAIAAREGIFERELRAFEDAARLAEATEPTLRQTDRQLFEAYCTLGARIAGGATALDLLKREDTLDPEERTVIDDLERGRFAVLRLEQIHVDEGFEAFDELEQQTLRIWERAATHDVSAGDLLLGWLCIDASGQVTLQGGLLHVAATLAPRMIELVTAQHAERRARFPDETAHERAAQLPPAILSRFETLREDLER